MKKIALFVALICGMQTVYAQIIPLDSISYYEGKTITINSKVQNTYVSNGEKKTVFLNFGKPFPNETFKVVIFENDLIHFKYAPSEFLKNKQVEITGRVLIYNKRPQMIITNESQIKIK